jgi:hypothetical protein
MMERLELFAQLPNKWDLADPLPEGIDCSSLLFLIMDSRKNRLQQEVFENLGMEMRK